MKKLTKKQKAKLSPEQLEEIEKLDKRVNELESIIKQNQANFGSQRFFVPEATLMIEDDWYPGDDPSGRAGK